MYNTGFRLVMRRGPQPNQIFELNKDNITIGRDVTNEITINDPEVSRHHCQLNRGPSGYTIKDLGSTNGTFVNGQRLTGERPLSPNDLVGLGETVTIAYDVGSGGVSGVGAAPAAPAYGGVPPDTGPTGPAGAMPPPPQYAQQGQPPPQPTPGYYEQPPQPASPYAGGYQQPQQPPPSPPYTYSEPPMPRSRGCGLWIGCGVIILLAFIFVIVGIIVVDSPLDDMPFVSDAADAISLPGTSVDNTEKFFEAVNSCDQEEAEQYVCSDQQDAVGSLFEGCQNNQYSSVSCEKDGNDVTCTFTFNNTEVERTMNIQNGKVCGTVFKFEGSSDDVGQEFDNPSDTE